VCLNDLVKSWLDRSPSLAHFQAKHALGLDPRVDSGVPQDKCEQTRRKRAKPDSIQTGFAPLLNAPLRPAPEARLADHSGWPGLVSAYRTIFEAPSLDLLLLLGQIREGNVKDGNGEGRRR
jgi:hypothetical protein